MPRRKLIRSSTLPYHLFGRTNNRDFFIPEMPLCWGVYEDFLARISNRFGARIHAFVLMSNHFHMIMTAAKAPVDDVMEYFMGETSRAINQLSERINHSYGGPYGRTLIESDAALAWVLKYVARNPVKAGLSARVEDYPYSTFRLLTASRPVHFPVFWTFGSGSAEAWLQWFNEPFSHEQDRLIQLALRRASFQFSRRYPSQRIAGSLTLPSPCQNR